MKTTFHINQRMKQRGITKEMINCVIELGEIIQDKYVIDKKLATSYIKLIQQEQEKRKLQ
ncbi:hypothetical protein AM305_04443 [Actinobacillus minor NM305]|uniref:Uncharacterized protein n=1 Tax=Actinobacillus minor NM305 TaxID=637911 RepID=C5RYW0_9PAST|nr:DUF4258 domain-containing protein [Actinobacillus minor]EER48147.1 hypothetical protein AM305_04443 [Actinobacillus minor NM305]